MSIADTVCRILFNGLSFEEVKVCYLGEKNYTVIVTNLGFKRSWLRPKAVVLRMDQLTPESAIILRGPVRHRKAIAFARSFNNKMNRF